jgi:hypothetical protein
MPPANLVTHERPHLWLLGSSAQSAVWAADLGLSYAFADFINAHGGEDAVTEHYCEQFTPRAICAETDAEANVLASSFKMLILCLQRGDLIAVPAPQRAAQFLVEYAKRPGTLPMQRRIIVGTPEVVKSGIEAIAQLENSLLLLQTSRPGRRLDFGPFSRGKIALKNVVGVFHDRAEFVNQELPFGLEIPKLQNEVNRNRDRTTCGFHEHVRTMDIHQLHRVGYTRVSSIGQNLNSQIAALKAAGCKKIFTDRMTGSCMDRPGWDQLMEYVRSGDILVVAELSRMTRFLMHLLETAQELDRKEVNSSLYEKTSIPTPPPDGGSFR